MSEDVIEFPKPENDTDRMFGTPNHPSWHSLIIYGRQIPNMKIREFEGKIEILLDSRFAFIFEDKNAAWTGAALAAEAMAIAMGYPHMGAENKDMPFAPKVIELGGLPE